MLTRDNFTGPWAGLPVAWTARNTFDEQTFRGDVARCCKLGMPGIYTGGTTGEFYAMEFDEFQAVARATVAEAHVHNKPAMIGVTSTYTLGACRRAAFAAEIGADAVQVALPFWMVVEDPQIVPFFREVSKACGLPVSIYETTRSKKVLTIDQHRAVKDAVPNYIMVKANANTVGDTPEGCRALSEFTNVFVGEDRWAELGPCGARGGCSSVVYWNPKVLLPIWQAVEKKDWPAVNAGCAKLSRMFAFLGEQWGDSGYQDSAFDRLGGVASGVLKCGLQCRAPYPPATEKDAQILRDWYAKNWPEMLEV